MRFHYSEAHEEGTERLMLPRGRCRLPFSRYHLPKLRQLGIRLHQNMHLRLVIKAVTDKADHVGIGQLLQLNLWKMAKVRQKYCEWPAGKT